MRLQAERFSRDSLENGMSKPIHSPSKIHVTSVTRVTPHAKRPDSLASAPVTRLRYFRYTSCNAALTCNARLSLPLLRANVRRAWLQRDSRWLRLQNGGRGIERYTLRDLGDD